MATEFVALQAPPGKAVLANYDRTLHSDQQPSSIPRTFTEAMEVREEVFVKSQGVPLENELDEDDDRSWHWVVYASVGNSGPPPAETSSTGNEDGEGRRQSESTATRVPVGTIRLVPPPHEPHPVPGGTEHHSSSVAAEAANSLQSNTPHFEEPSEPYIKLGRIAVLPPYRGLGLSRLLINAAISWAKDHAEDIMPSLSPADIEAAKQEGKKELMPWKGLILVHAQTAVQKLWESFGFVKDDSMGTWIEEGIPHIGLWRTIELNGDEHRGSLSK